VRADPFALLEGLSNPTAPAAGSGSAPKPAIDLDALYGLGASGPAAGVGFGGGAPALPQGLGFGAGEPLLAQSLGFGAGVQAGSGMGDLGGTANLMGAHT
jgi:hypothetical protein